jgi:hypothetical protein
MKSIKIAMSLVFASFLLAACGGGGDARSPDRPGLTIDPATLRMEFVNNVSTLPGTGNSRISVRMLALRSDGINKNVGPEMVITDQVRWQLSANLGSPEKAELDVNGDGSPKFRDTVRDGKVQDILNRVQMGVDDADINATVTGTFTKSGKTYSKTLPFTVVPPTPAGSPKIVGKELILLDPLIENDSETTNYRLLQYFTNTPIPENITDTVYICSSDTALAEPSADQPVALNGSVPVTYKSPFTSDGNNAERQVTLFAIDADSNPNGCVGATSDGIRELTVTIKPATFAKVDICAVINPTASACDEGGVLDQNLVASCKGLNSNSISVPAAQRLQFVARLTYNNVQNPGQTLQVYQCSDNDNDVWSTRDGDLIYSSDPKVDPKEGFAVTVDGATYDELKAAGGIALTSVVTGNFGNNVPDLADTLELNLVGPRVDEIKIERVDGLNNDTNGPDTLYVNSFLDGIEYRALCKFTELAGGTGAFEACPNGLIEWESSVPATALPIPDTSVNTTLTAQAGATSGQLDLKLTYFGSDEPVSVTRPVNAVDPGTLTELRLFMVPNGNEPDTLAEDEFACVGRDNLVETLEDGEQFVRGGQQFEAYANFSGLQGSTDLPTEGDLLGADNTSTTRLLRVTDQSNIAFTAIPGFWSGDFADPAECQTAINDSVPVEDISGGIGEFAVVDGAASFDPNKKGRLKSDGLLRLSTVCVQAQADTDLDSNFETKSVDGASVLVLPAADDKLLTYSNELCEVLEPVLTMSSFPGAGFETPGVILPVIYGISLVADPLLATLISNDDGGTIPAEAIIEGLVTGDFSALDPSAPDLGAGLGDLTSLLLSGGDQLPAGLGAIVDAVDACLAAPVLSVTDALLDTLLGFNPEDFQNFDDTFYDDCINLFEGLAP